jgi:hypothetical protein
LLLLLERQVNILARKKIVFVIVEGPSDQDSLELLLDKIFDKNKIYVHVTHGDITSDLKNNPSNILKKVTEEIKGYARNYHLDRVHFQEIIHIVDTDGAYVSDECIEENPELNKPLYYENTIVAKNKQNIVNRNRNKSKNIDKLSMTSKIWGEIPYSVYYMSCNLDHVLYNKLNTSDEEKENDSYCFAKKYRNDIEGFKVFITKSYFSVEGDYIETWKYIKEGTRSLERHTNIGLCFPEED